MDSMWTQLLKNKKHKKECTVMNDMNSLWHLVGEGICACWAPWDYEGTCDVHVHVVRMYSWLNTSVGECVRIWYTVVIPLEQRYWGFTGWCRENSKKDNCDILNWSTTKKVFSIKNPWKTKYWQAYMIKKSCKKIFVWDGFCFSSIPGHNKHFLLSIF